MANGRSGIDPTHKLRPILGVIALILVSVFVVGALYLNAQPETYDVEVGQVAPSDIVSTRAIPDAAATELAARQAELQTRDVLVRSEVISRDALAALQAAFDTVEGVRATLYPGAEAIYQRMRGGETATPDAPLPEVTEPLDSSQTGPAPTADPNLRRSAAAARAGAETPDTTAPDTTEPVPPEPLEDPEIGTLALGEQADRLFYRTRVDARARQTGVDALMAEPTTEALSPEVADQLLAMPPSLFYTLRLHTTAIADVIMSGRYDAAGLPSAIRSMTENLLAQSQYYEVSMAFIPTLLETYLVPNMTYDAQATLGAREAARRAVLADPVMIDAGTRVVSAGDIVTEAQYAMLLDLELVDSDTFDWPFLTGLILLYLLLAGSLIIYLTRYEQAYVRTTADYMIITLSILAVFVVSMYVTRIHTILPPVYFVVVIAAAYFELRTALVLSLFTLMLVYPMSFGDTKFLVTAVLTSIIVSLVMARQAKRSSYAPTIAAGIMASFLTAAAYGLLAGDSMYRVLTDASFVAISAAAAIIAAVGSMPIFEIFLSAVSPLKLINLAQPSQPLLQRLFIEAPGTYQHSMMVANLAEAGAQQIGANALLIRVGAYYHDIGKLDNPLMFTENQSGYNPHDYLPPEESVRIIMRHVSTGLETAQRHRLPRSIQAMIIEHHGTSVMTHFYTAAKANAERDGMPEPDINDFRYPWQKPQSKETAVLMLADTLEAAMKSIGISNIEDAEVLARRLVKGKNDQDQLVESGLSFNEVETVIKAFMQVYAGQFHERVKYPDAPSGSQTARA